MPFKNETGIDLQQDEREAIVDLLHLCLYADAHISLKESEFIADVVRAVGWNPNMDFASYEARSIAAARAARADEHTKEEFLHEAAARLKSPASKKLATDVCRDLCSADGMAPREESLIQAIERTLGE